MNLFETVKASVSVPAAAKMYGLQVNHHGMTKCPFHDDRHPSMKLNKDYFYCFGCVLREMWLTWWRDSLISGPMKRQRSWRRTLGSILISLRPQQHLQNQSTR